MSGTPEFSRRVKLARIGAEPYRQRISASEDERAALARRFDLVSLDRLDAAVELIPRRSRGDPRGERATILLRADFEAAFAQRCIVTLDPIAGVLAERFELLYGPPEAEEAAVQPGRRGRRVRAARRRRDRHRRGGCSGILAGAAAVSAQPRNPRRSRIRCRRLRPIRLPGCCGSSIATAARREASSAPPARPASAGSCPAHAIVIAVMAEFG